MSSVESTVWYILFIFPPKKLKFCLHDAWNRQSNLLLFVAHFSKTICISQSGTFLLLANFLSFNLAYQCENAIFKVLIWKCQLAFFIGLKPCTDLWQIQLPLMENRHGSNNTTAWWPLVSPQDNRNECGWHRFLLGVKALYVNSIAQTVTLHNFVLC